MQATTRLSPSQNPANHSEGRWSRSYFGTLCVKAIPSASAVTDGREVTDRCSSYWPLGGTGPPGIYALSNLRPTCPVSLTSLTQPHGSCRPPGTLGIWSSDTICPHHLGPQVSVMVPGRCGSSVLSVASGHPALEGGTAGRQVCRARRAHLRKAGPIHLQWPRTRRPCHTRGHRSPETRSRVRWAAQVSDAGPLTLLRLLTTGHPGGSTPGAGGLTPPWLSRRVSLGPA